MSNESHDTANEQLRLTSAEVVLAPKAGLHQDTVNYLAAVGGLNKEAIQSMFKSGDLNVDLSSLTKNARGGETPDGVQSPVVGGQAPQNPYQGRE